MTVRQKQLLLAWMGCLEPKDVDGIWGPQSAGATERMQKILGLHPDGVWGDQTDAAVREYIYSGTDIPEELEQSGTFWDHIRYFTREEFRCQCGGKYCNGFPVEPEPELVRVCNEIRRRLDVPVTIVESGGSGVRCAQHNANVKGAKNSNHLYGKAADLHSDKSPQEMYRVAEDVLGNTGELGIYSWGIHVAVNCNYSRFTG